MASKNLNDKDQYKKMKLERTVLFFQNHGRKLVTCGACSGTGIYDSKGSPKCDNCNGTGKTKG